MKRNNGTVPQAVFYLRLSKEDGRTESASIGAQRLLLQRYAAQHGIPVAAEYVDDGYSGTNFDRPAFLRMLADIESGRIHTVITKDLSRLGRDYIQAGQYTEQYFPAKGVRFIAVNDGYDSAESDNDIIPFKNILNEMYARDTSKKIRSAFQAKMAAGKHIAAFAPYGYIKDPQDHNRLIIDPEAGRIVKQIFHAAAAGQSPACIANRLNAQQIPAPLAHRLSTKHDKAAADDLPAWCAATIIKMLHNGVYCGHSIQGKSRKLSFKHSYSVRVPSEQQFIVRNTHPPLVDESVFSYVQKKLAARRHNRAGRFCNRFSGIAYCADCHHRMSSAGTRKKGAAANLVCGSYKLRGKSACSNHFLDYGTLEHIVSKILTEQLQACLSESSDIRLNAQTLSPITPESPIFNRLLYAMVECIEIGQGSYSKANGIPTRHQEICIRLCFQVEPMTREFRF